jgi:molecular chaperone GrpE
VTDSKRKADSGDSGAKPLVRDSGPGEGVWGNREVPPAVADAPEQQPEAEAAPAPDELAAVTAERDEYLDLLQRVQADFENYRKRAARDQERLVAHAHERLVRELLPVLDDLERAAQPPVRDSGPREGVWGNRVEVPPAVEDQPDLRSELDALREGVTLVQKALRQALAREGLAEIPTEGAFDPHVHEALLTQPSADAEPGSVLEVVQRGYRLGDKVVRPARVIVASEPSEVR